MSWSYLPILLAFYSFTSCATNPVTVKSDQPIEKKSKQVKLSSEKIKQVPHVIEKQKSLVSEGLDRGAQIGNESRDSSLSKQADLKKKDTDSLNQLKGNDRKRSIDLGSIDKDAGISSDLKTNNENIVVDIGIDNKKMNLSNENTNQEEEGGLESFFSVGTSKPSSGENGEIKSTTGGILTTQKEEAGGDSSKSKANINKIGDPSLYDSGKSLGGSLDSLSNPVGNEEEISEILESKGVVPSSGLNKAVGFVEGVQSTAGNDSIKNDLAVGFLESANYLEGKGELYSPVQHVGFGEKNQKIPNTEAITDSTRKDKIKRQKPRTFGRIRTFLDRGEVSGVKEGVLDERGFDRTKDFIDADRSARAQDLPVSNQENDIQYGKTLKWIKNRGRID